MITVVTRGRTSITFGALRRRTIIAAMAFSAVALSAGLARGAPRGGRWCSNTTSSAHHACRFEALAEYNLTLGKCENFAEFAERSACRQEARAALREALAECREQFEARRELCTELGQAPYDPEIDPENFVRESANPFFPLTPGKKYTYEGETEDGLARVEVEVTDETKTILGVVCTAVKDTEFLDGELVEETVDYFAPDKDGNVWYFGEDTKEVEDGVVVSLSGAWQAGVDGARPGIIMKAAPEVGDIYRQEFLLGEAEDVGEVIALNQDVSVPAGTFQGCLETEDTTPLEPDALEHKFYAPGVGLVLEVDIESGERLELVKVEG